MHDVDFWTVLCLFVYSSYRHGIYRRCLLLAQLLVGFDEHFNHGRDLGVTVTSGSLVSMAQLMVVVFLMILDWLDWLSASQL